MSLAIEQNSSGTRGHKPEQKTQKSGFTRAGFTANQAKRLAGRKREVDRVDSALFAEGADYFFGSEQRGHGVTA